MRNIEVEELKKIQIQILDVVDTYCRNNNVNYWIDSGTLLGAVRHRGYIEYSCAVTPQIRQMGNHLSGNAGTAYASLLA